MIAAIAGVSYHKRRMPRVQGRDRDNRMGSGSMLADLKMESKYNGPFKHPGKLWGKEGGMHVE